MPGFGPSITVTVLDDDLRRLAVAFAGLAPEATKTIHAYHTNVLGQLARTARGKFEGSKIRFGETGEGRGGRRQTGNFDFGIRSGGAFVGRLIKTKDSAAFGWPDTDVADAKTKGVWRGLEYGLPGTKRGTPESRFGITPHTGTHMIPYLFYFKPRNPPSAAVMQPLSRKGESQEGGGIEGKHFLEDSIIEVVGADGAKLRKKYQLLVKQAIAKLIK